MTNGFPFKWFTKQGTQPTYCNNYTVLLIEVKWLIDGAKQYFSCEAKQTLISIIFRNELLEVLPFWEWNSLVTHWKNKIFCRKKPFIVRKLVTPPFFKRFTRSNCYKSLLRKVVGMGQANMNNFFSPSFLRSPLNFCGTSSLLYFFMAPSRELGLRDTRLLSTLAYVSKKKIIRWIILLRMV